MEYVINNNTSYDLTQLEELARQFLPFAQKRMGFNKPPTINFASDEENCANPLGKTASYSPSDMEITILVDKRHAKDILRSLSHELVHHNQNCRGDFNRSFSTEPGYAQNDEFLRNMEDEAYREGNFCLRDWEDGIKTSKIKNIQLNETIYKRTVNVGDNDMSTKDWKDKELNNLLMEKWGYTLKEDLTPYMDEKDYSTAQMGSLEDGEAELRKEEDDDEREVELESQLSEEHPHSPDQREVKEVKKKINNESVSRDKSLSRKDKSVLFEQEEEEVEVEEEVEEEKAVGDKEGKKSKKNDQTSDVKSGLDMAKSIISGAGAKNEDSELQATSAKRKLEILNQMIAGEGPIIDEFEKHISSSLKQSYLDNKEDIDIKQVDFLTKDALKTIQATAQKAKKALVAAGKKNKESKKKLEKSLSEGIIPQHDILLYEFRQQKSYRKRVDLIDRSLSLLDEGVDKNLFPAIALLNEGLFDFAARPVVTGLSKVATNKLMSKLMQKMIKRGGLGSRISYDAMKKGLTKSGEWIAKPRGKDWVRLELDTLKTAALQRGIAIPKGINRMAPDVAKKQLAKQLRAFSPKKTLAARAAFRKAQKEAAKQAAKEAGKAGAKETGKAGAKEAAKKGAKEAPKGFWRNLVRGNVFRALSEFCKKHPVLCTGLGIYAALEVIGNVAEFGDGESEEQRYERQRLLDAMSDEQLRELCAKGNKHACIELEVRKQDREAGDLPDTPDSGIGAAGGVGGGVDKSFMVGTAAKPKGSFLGMSINWLEGRGWRWNGVDFAKTSRPGYWLSRDHCKGTKFCTNRGGGKKKEKPIPTTVAGMADALAATPIERDDSGDLTDQGKTAIAMRHIGNLHRGGKRYDDTPEGRAAMERDTPQWVKDQRKREAERDG